MLELRKLLAEIESMSEEMAMRAGTYANLAERARDALARFAEVDDTLLDKIDRAAAEDLSWRGARPVGERLDETHVPQTAPQDATLIGVDGSQIYPDPHGLAFYYLLNTGAIVLRQGSGEAPETSTNPAVFFREADLYTDDNEPVDSRAVNAAREMAELVELRRLAEKERERWGGDLDRLVIAMTDGPLLIWIGEKEIDSAKVRQRIDGYVGQLQAIQSCGGAPVGYVDRPRSANVLRLLHVAALDLMEIKKDTIRSTRYRGLTDRKLFEFLKPNERSALFSSTAQVNEKQFRAAGQEIQFFYMNVSSSDSREDARIVRVDAPAWVTGQPDLLDLVQQAIYRDCEGTGYPYVLARAHELAVVSHRQRRDFEQMLATEMLRKGLLPASSQKAFLKSLR